MAVPMAAQFIRIPERPPVGVVVVNADYDFDFEATVIRRGRTDDTVEDEVLTYRVHLDWLAGQRQKEVSAAGHAACEDAIWNDIVKDWADLIELLER
ncbi:MAG: hypothetical protein ACOYB2_10675 [Limnohabitans sp.]